MRIFFFLRCVAAESWFITSTFKWKNVNTQKKTPNTNTVITRFGRQILIHWVTKNMLVKEVNAHQNIASKLDCIYKFDYLLTNAEFPIDKRIIQVLCY